jgi:tetratricopeptide (TPR) repeat protein
VPTTHARSTNTIRPPGLFSLALALAVCAFATAGGAGAAVASGTGASPSAADKVPITTASDSARKAYLEARSLVERLRVQEAKPVFARAIDADPSFALGWLGLAGAQNTPGEFFAALDKASALAGQASAGERLMIEAAQAAAHGDNATQTRLLEKLVRAYPADERAQVLLGNAHFAAQRYPEAIAAYERAVAIAPEFSQSYNQLGYSYRFLGRFDDAEKTFARYTQVLPDDPNPWDSLAELQMKRGRFDDAIASYRKALAVRPDFFNSNLGIATCLDLQGKHAAARAELDAMLARAKDDGQRRAGLFARTVSYAYEGNWAAARKEMDKQYAIAEKAGDALGMSGDQVAMGVLALATGEADAAAAHFAKALALAKAAPDVADAVKENQARFAMYNRARVALARGDLAAAKKEQQALATAAGEAGNPFQIRFGHEIAGRIALAEQRWDDAIAELGQANQLDPYVRLRLAQAWAGKGDQAKAKQLADGARNDNTLVNLNLALVRQDKTTI